MIVNIDVYLYSAEVMELLIQSSDLFVMQVEMDVYTALKKVHKCNSQKALLRRHVPTTSPFLCFCLCSGCFYSSTLCGTARSSSSWLTPMLGCANAEQVQLGYLLFPLVVFVFVLLKRLCPTDLCEKEPFLDTEDGLPFRSVFKHVRLQYIINDLASARILERDNILPPGENESDETFLGGVVAMLHLLVFIFIILFQIG